MKAGGCGGHRSKTKDFDTCLIDRWNQLGIKHRDVGSMLTNEIKICEEEEQTQCIFRVPPVSFSRAA